MNAMRQPLGVDVRIERLRLKSPFRISGYTFTEVPIALVTLHQGGVEGCGEAAGVYYLDDTPGRMARTIEAHRRIIESGINRERLMGLLPAGGARNALDCALWELESKQAGQPVWKLAGIERPIPKITTFTLGADDPRTVADGAEALTDARSLKLKLSGEIEVDAERVRAVRAARPDVWLGVDANQGFTLDSLSKLLPVLVAARVELIEQPLARGHEAELERFDSPIPLAADESVQGLADMGNLVGRFDVVNIKLDKCGGLTEALAMAERARQLGLKVMVGNMVGSSLAMAPAFVLAQLCDFIDLDGPTFLAADRTPSIVYRDGAVWCPEEVWGVPASAV
jgi:L-alanine-DL-glutamate epimerase-like enolase superfamily enzyme